MIKNNRIPRLKLTTETVRALAPKDLANAIGGQFITTNCTGKSQRISDCICQTE